MKKAAIIFCNKQWAPEKKVTISDNGKMPDGTERAIIMTDRTKIPIEDVRYIEGDLF